MIRTKKRGAAKRAAKRRGYRGIVGPVRLGAFLSWLVIAAGIHYLVLFTALVGAAEEPDPGVAQGGGSARRRAIELVALAGMQRALEEEQAPNRTEPEPEPVKEPEPEPQAAPVVEPEPELVPVAVKTPEEPPTEPEPERTVRRAIEGQDRSPESEFVEEPPAALTPLVPEELEGDVEVQETPPAAELRRAEWQRIFDDPEKADGHFFAALQRWEEQAQRKRERRPRRAEGEEEGLPQLLRYPPESDAEFFSALELFGGEVFVRIGDESWWHLERSGRRFAPRPISERELKDIARRRRLNLGFMIELDSRGRLPAELSAARTQALEQSRGADGGRVQTIFLGTTREQSAVADAAQTFLRRKRTEFPQYQIWSQARDIRYRYLRDDREVVYGVQITEIE